jgi:vacuolar-type H+-ATPase subunit I/STV1
MVKNNQVHVFLGKELKDKLKREASERGISLSELCRQKLNSDSQLTRIEESIAEIRLKLSGGKQP